MKKIFLLAAAVPFFAYAFQWPVANKVLTATFGENRWNHFHNGIDIGGGAQDVRPVSKGEMIYYHEENIYSLPTGLGSFAVIEHEKGFRSIYAHLQTGSIKKDEFNVTESTVIGIIGESGSSYGKHLHFEIVDEELKQSINPLLVLPLLKDKRKPVINSIMLINDNNTVILQPGMTLPAGKYSLAVETWDASEAVAYFCPMAPYELSAYLNGETLKELQFKGIAEAEELVLFGKDRVSRKELYLSDWVYRITEITLRPGTAVIELSVKDFAENETVKSISVKVADN